MLMYGKKIVQSADPLVKMQVKQLADKVRNPDQELFNLLDALSSMVFIDPEGYRRRKKFLPYVVPSIFAPPVRRIDNFRYSEHIILDIDHLEEKQLDPERLKDKLAKDPRVELIFVSPSKQGLKVFFRLKQRITDPHIYSAFYKTFAQNFARSYGIAQNVDNRTSDVTRACFLSFDPNLYYNENPELVDIEPFLSNIKAFNILAEQPQDKQQNDNQENTEVVITKKKKEKKDIPVDVFQQIKQKLNPDYRPPQPKRKVIFVPKHLELIQQKVMEKLKQQFPEIEIEQIKDINYGKQFLFKYQLFYAELNVFFGKRGLTVVKTTKKINNPEFQEIVYQIFHQIIYNDEEIQKIARGNSAQPPQIPPKGGHQTNKENQKD